MSEFFKSIKRAPYQSLAIFSSLFFALFLSIIIFFTLSFLHSMLSYIESRPQVTVYFKTQTPESDIFQMRDELMNSGKVVSVKYVTKNDAFAIYKELNKDNPLLLEMVSADILPASLEIYAKKPEFLPEIADSLKNRAGVDEVNFQKVIIDRLITLTSIIRKTTFAFFAFLIFNTIITLLTIGHFKIALKKDEIELLQFLGASKWYIKKPFVVESIMFGIMAAVTAFTLCAGILFYFLPFLSSYMRGIGNLTLNFDLFQLKVWPINPEFLGAVFGLSCLFGIVIATVSTLLATRKYIK